jgi:hypothetical protein
MWTLGDERRLEAVTRELDATMGNTCTRCQHPRDWHRHDDADPIPPDDPRCPFRCLGYDCMGSGPPGGACDCPDFVAREGLADWETA